MGVVGKEDGLNELNGDWKEISPFVEIYNDLNPRNRSLIRNPFFIDMCSCTVLT